MSSADVDSLATLKRPGIGVDGSGSTVNGAKVVLPADWNRLYLLFKNDSTTAMRIRFGSVLCTATTGMQIDPSWAFILGNQENVPGDQISVWCSAASQNYSCLAITAYKPLWAEPVHAID
jgi:hypothetical protein